MLFYKVVGCEENGSQIEFKLKMLALVRVDAVNNTGKQMTIHNPANTLTIIR